MLSKSDIQSYLQCPRRLWLEHHSPELIPKDDITLFRRAVDGNIVGKKAMEALGTGCIVPPGGQENAEKAAEAARGLLKEADGRPAAEVPMAFGGLYARADALLTDGKSFILRETKASTFPLKGDKVTPSAPEEHHLTDVAIQLWVMEKSGLTCSRAELNLLNNQWQYPGNDDYAGLFRQMDVTALVRPILAQVPKWLTDASRALAGGKPEVTTGRHCKEPYPCPFSAHCVELDPKGPEHPIELLPDLAGKNLAGKLKESKGYTSLLEPKPEELTGKQAALYQRIQRAHRDGNAVMEVGCEKQINDLPYPRYYFDFEGIDFPVPRWPGIRPYQQVPFQWSCHIERAAGQFEHTEFLDLTGNDPSLACIEAMKRTLGDSGPIVVYYATYERSRLLDYAQRFTEHKPLIEGFMARLFDLHPVVKEHFYDPRMRGSYSIKAVLPVIAADMDYGQLVEIQEGTAAQVAYLHITMDPDVIPDRRHELEANLRAYCRQDTWAMVEVAYHLARLPRPKRPVED